MTACLFCDLQRSPTPPVGGVIYEDDLIYAHHAHFGEGPVYLGNLMIETRRHTPDFASLTPAEAQATGALIARLSRALKACTGAERVYVECYAEVTPHLHTYLIARYPGAPAEYLRWNAKDWPDAPRGGAPEVTALCERLRAALAEDAQ